MRQNDTPKTVGYEDDWSLPKLVEPISLGLAISEAEVDFKQTSSVFLTRFNPSMNSRPYVMMLSIPWLKSFELYPYIMVRQVGRSLERKSRNHILPSGPFPLHEPYAWPSRPVIAMMLFEQTLASVNIKRLLHDLLYGHWTCCFRVIQLCEAKEVSVKGNVSIVRLDRIVC